MWQSQLAFIKGEQAFLKALLTKNTLHLLAETGYEMAKHLATALSKLSGQLPELLERIGAHRNEIIVLMDDKDEFQKERTFKDTHLLLEMRINSYLEKYHLLKEDIFKTMQNVIKKGKKTNN
jgi:hypothetical protein